MGSWERTQHPCDLNRINGLDNGSILLLVVLPFNGIIIIIIMIFLFNK